VKDLQHVEGVLQTRAGLGDSRPSTKANRRMRDAVQRPTGSQGSTTGMRGRRAGTRGRIGGRSRIGGRGRGPRAGRGTNSSERGDSPNRAIELDEGSENEQVSRETSREL